METTYFKLMGQKTGDKLVLFAVVDKDFLGKIPSIFQAQCIKMPPTIYTGTYPTLKINTDTIEDVTEEFKGDGIAGILTEAAWYCKTTNEKDIFGIEIKPK